MKRKTVAVTREEILAHLEEVFRVSLTGDVSYNGLQFEGSEIVTKIATGVDATADFIGAAVSAGADFALVHHGIFWKGGEWKRIDRFARRLVGLMEGGNLNLYGLHLPLDMHPEFGNNPLLARLLDAEVVEPFGDFMGQKVGVLARLSRPLTPAALRKRLEKAVGPVAHHLAFGSEKIETLGIVSGGGWSSVSDAAVAAGRVDAIVTGEVIHQAVPPCRERGVHLFAAGHYATETFGVRATGEALARKFGLEHVFIDLPTGL
ncbi:MAG TPA: Nif3-like dinuclear metal center hexameric protein [Candidatus Ozemobacteraceae bacterium]